MPPTACSHTRRGTFVPGAASIAFMAPNHPSGLWVDVMQPFVARPAVQRGLTIPQRPAG